MTSFVPHDRVRVPFAGEGSGEAPLTWGQREIWEPFELAGRSLAMGGAMALPKGTSVAEAVTVLRFSMSRHEGLRTRFRCDDAGRPQAQVLHAAGEIDLEIFDVPESEDPAAFAQALSDEYEWRQFDYVHEWPVRMGVVRQGGTLTHAVVMYCHLIIDGYGLDALSRDLVNLDRSTGAVRAEVSGIPPLAQARRQATPQARRQSESSMRYWEGLLRSIPASRLPGSDDPRTPRYWQIGLTSRAAHLALRPIVARTRVDSSAVLLAAFAVSLARVTGISPSAVRTVMSNRFRPGFAESVSVVNQTGLCVLDVAGTTFDEVVVRAWRASLGAGLHSYYDPWRLKELVAQVGRERGEELDLACFFNDLRRQRQPTVVEPMPAVWEVGDALSGSELRWIYQQDQPNEHIFACVNDVSDTVDITVCVDTHLLSPADLWACARGIEEILVAAAFDERAATGVPARPSTPDEAPVSPATPGVPEPARAS